MDKKGVYFWKQEGYSTQDDYKDTTIGCSLKPSQVDHNFYFLRGYDIVSGECENKNIILHRINGENISINLTDLPAIVDTSNSTYDTEKGELHLIINGNETIIEGFTIDKYQELYTYINSQLYEINCSINGITENLESLHIELENAQNSINNIDGEIIDIQNKLNSSDTRITSIESNVLAINQEINNINVDIQTLFNIGKGVYPVNTESDLTKKITWDNLGVNTNNLYNGLLVSIIYDNSIRMLVNANRWNNLSSWVKISGNIISGDESHTNKSVTVTNTSTKMDGIVIPAGSTLQDVIDKVFNIPYTPEACVRPSVKLTRNDDFGDLYIINDDDIYNSIYVSTAYSTVDGAISTFFNGDIISIPTISSLNNNENIYYVDDIITTSLIKLFPQNKIGHYNTNFKIITKYEAYSGDTKPTDSNGEIYEGIINGVEYTWGQFETSASTNTLLTVVFPFYINKSGITINDTPTFNIFPTEAIINTLMSNTNYIVFTFDGPDETNANKAEFKYKGNIKIERYNNVTHEYQDITMNFEKLDDVNGYHHVKRNGNPTTKNNYRITLTNE